MSFSNEYILPPIRHTREGTFLSPSISFARKYWSSLSMYDSQGSIFASYGSIWLIDAAIFDDFAA